MEHDRRIKVVAIIALVVAVLGLSVGFSAYSKALNIQNVQATVQGNPANFDVEFSTVSDSVSSGTVEGKFYMTGSTVAKAGVATLNGTTISGLTYTYSGSGDYVIYYEFYAYNNGSIPAYLTGITYGDTTCIPGSGTSNELVQAECNRFTHYVTIDKKNYKSNTKITDSVKLNPGESQNIWVMVGFSGEPVKVDGDFIVKYGDITLNYSSQKPSA